MAVGWAGDGAVQDQISATVADEAERARARLPQGPSLEFCEECDEPIAEGRRRALPGVRLCLDCQREAEKSQASRDLYNRRGSKDSQLK